MASLQESDLLIPSCTFRYTLRRGLQGHDVWALQLGLNAWREIQDDLPPLAEDGVFGGNTERGAKTFQRRLKLVVDGICGPVSQRALADQLIRPKVEAFNLPQGLLHGGCELESAYFVGATNCKVAGGIDCGWMQHRVPDGSPEDAYRKAFSGPESFGSAAQTLRNRYDYYHGQPGAATSERAWEVTCGSWNWPACADHYAAGDIASWSYRSDGKRYSMNDAAPWIEAASGGRLHTGYEWWNFYVGQWLIYTQWGQP